MDFKFLMYSVKEGVATLSLNRPEVYNALNDEITYELQDAWKQIAKDDQVRVVVLTGEGKAFCSGQDLKAGVDGEKRSFMESLHKRYNPIIRAMRNLPKPIICRLNGVAAGAGCSMWRLKRPHSLRSLLILDWSLIPAHLISYRN
jgi:2-(1,2-epoxy-1,2-dihydrophenyl)acetyl-CoA isomerase